IANPNNPTATIATADEIEHFVSRVPERTIVVFDEAYIEFALGPDFPETLNYVKQGRKVVVLRTFSKATSLAGLRVGYGVADADNYQKPLHEGVIVRPMTPFGMETALRITVGTPEENRKLVKALRTVLGKKPA